MFYSNVSSPLGPLLLTSDGTSLTGLRMAGQGILHPGEARRELPVFRAAEAWLDDYFAGRCRDVDFPLEPLGTDFQKRVWQLLLTIPYGKTTTYGNLAKTLGPGMSAQAVGQAVGKNPLAVLIPCHRVVGARGQLTGYAWGLENKEWLLRHEEETK